ncbi:MAG: U32 family peptidase [Erysipelotrichales bacterium]|nr:U32 family peptidase [Erysipelotrichales bacterium]
MTELLAPAGDLEKLNIAYLYGADACYIGGKKFSLRSRASNFTEDDLIEAVKIAKSYQKKLYITVNIIPHNEDLAGLEAYLSFLEKIGVDGIISASLHIIKLALDLTKLEVHVSTQLSVLNSEAIDFLTSLGVQRVVLGRELSYKELAEIKQKSALELEVFIHGGMCAGYSGRCVLSNNMTDRDANRGGCAHSCRWNFDLFHKGEKLNDEANYFSMAAKDLQAIRYIPRLLDIGINSLKIEGRMKSLYYIALVVKTYRTLIDSYQRDKKINFAYYLKEIKKAENRMTASGYLEGAAKENKTIYKKRAETPRKDFVGLVLAYDQVTKIVTVEQRNYFMAGQKLEFFGPSYSKKVTVKEIRDEAGTILDACRHPLQKVYFKLNFTVSKYDLIRLA